MKAKREAERKLRCKNAIEFGLKQDRVRLTVKEREKLRNKKLKKIPKPPKPQPSFIDRIIWLLIAIFGISVLCILVLIGYWTFYA